VPPVVRRNHRAIPHGQPDSVTGPTNAVRVTGARPKKFSRLRLDGSPRYYFHRGLRIPEPRRWRYAHQTAFYGKTRYLDRKLNV